MTTAPRILLAGVTLAAALCLSACANPLDGIVEGVVNQGVENVIEGAIEGETGGDVEFSAPGTGGSSLPDSWPADVPTPEGEILFSLASDGTYSATILVSDIAVVEAVHAELEAGGYALISEADFGGIVSKVFEGEAYSVTSGVVPDEETGGFSVQWGIVTRTP